MTDHDTTSPQRPAKTALRPVKPPAKQALILICRRCERRVAKGGDASRRLARRVTKLGKEQLGKGAVRTAFTSCMSLCPRDALAVSVVPAGKHAAAASMYIVDAARPKAGARALLAALPGN